MTNTSGKNIKYLKQHNLGIATILAFALIPLSGFATDIYIPSLPAMTDSLKVSNLQAQATLSLFLISYGVSQLFIGSIVDSFGRYRLSLICLLIFAASCIIVARTHSIYLIYLMRIIHGITVATIVVAKRAFFVDVYKGDKLNHYLSLFTIAWSSGPIVAPFIGGYLQTSFGWESNFYFLAGLALVLFFLELIYSGESLKNFSEFHVKKIAGVYIKMIKTSSFSLGLLMLGLAYCMIMIYNMAGPFIIEHSFKMSPVVSGYSSLILGFAWMVGGFVGKATMRKPFIKKMTINIVFQLAFIIAMFAAIPFFNNLYSLIFFAFLIHVTAGYIFNNYFTFCLGRFPENAGTAGGLTGGITYVIVSSLSYVMISIFPAQDLLNLNHSYFILAVLSALVMFAIYRLTEVSSK